MKFLVLAALVAVAAADVHDAAFHFGSFSGTQSPLLTKKYTTVTPAYAKQYTAVHASPVYSSLVQPAFGHQYVKHVEHEVPVYHHDAAHHFAHPLYADQHYAVRKFAEPLLVNKPVAHHVHAHYNHEVAQPVFSQFSTLKKVAQPVYTQYKHEVAQPVYTQYKHEIAQPVYTQYKHEIAQPVYTQYKHEVAQPVYTQYSAVKKVSQPALFSQYATKPLVAQQYSGYAADYNGPHFRILSQVHDADVNGAYKTSYATENGIQHTEQGALIASPEGAAVATQGSYSYTGPDGQVYTVNYIADENGFRAAGDHLPTPPPVPAEIARSLEENAASSEQYDDQGRLIHKL